MVGVEPFACCDPGSVDQLASMAKVGRRDPQRAKRRDDVQFCLVGPIAHIADQPLLGQELNAFNAAASGLAGGSDSAQATPAGRTKIRSAPRPMACEIAALSASAPSTSVMPSRRTAGSI